MRPIARPRRGIVRQRRETERPDSATSNPRSATRWSRISPKRPEPSGTPLPTIVRRRPRIARPPGATGARRHKTGNNDATNAASAATEGRIGRLAAAFASCRADVVTAALDAERVPTRRLVSVVRA
jgi:hypothetical protein